MFDGLTSKHIIFLDSKKFNSKLEFLQSVNKKTGETKGYENADYKGLHFTITNYGIVKMRGSLHKFKNNGLHNRDDFTFNEVCNVVSELENVYGIDTKRTRINTIEIGLNIVTDFNPNTFLKRLLTHKNSRFNKERNRDNELFFVVKHEDYGIKIYSKGKGILRFEIKTNRNKYFNKIKTLIDLTKKEVWQLAFKKIIDEFDNVIYWDELKECTPTKVKQYITEKQNLPYLETSKRNKSKELKKYNEFLIKYGANDYYKIKDLLNKKFNELINSEISVKNGCKLPNFRENEIMKNEQVKELDRNLKINNLIDNELTTKNGCKLPNFRENEIMKNEQVKELDKKNVVNELTNNELTLEKSDLNKKNRVQITILDKLVKCTPLKIDVKKCTVTGLNISMQKKGSKFLNVTGVAFYYKNQQEIYKELEKMLSEYWDGAPLEIRFREIAHQIRNEYNNKLHSEKKKIKKLTSYPIMFGVNDVLDFKYLNHLSIK